MCKSVRPGNPTHGVGDSV